MKFSIGRLLFLGVSTELFILLVSYLLHPELQETFRFAARYSGRLSAIVFLYIFYRYAISFPLPLSENKGLRNFIRLFAVLHMIHFGFLSMNIYLNEISLVPAKLTGGALAYLMIVLAPFVLHQLKTFWQMIYFYYVTIVMMVTYFSRLKGDFEGATPYWFHYVALGTFVLSTIFFSMRMFRANK